MLAVQGRAGLAQVMARLSGLEYRLDRVFRPTYAKTMQKDRRHRPASINCQATKPIGTLFMKKLLAGRASFIELKQAVEKAAGDFIDHDVVVRFENDRRVIDIAEVRFISPDSIAFNEIERERRTIPGVIVPGGQEFQVVMDVIPKKTASRIITKFTDAK